MSLEWMGPEPPVVLIAGDYIDKQDQHIETPFAFYFAPNGDGVVICGTTDELMGMLVEAGHRLQTIASNLPNITLIQEKE